MVAKSRISVTSLHRSEVSLGVSKLLFVLTFLQLIDLHHTSINGTAIAFHKKLFKDQNFRQFSRLIYSNTPPDFFSALWRIWEILLPPFEPYVLYNMSHIVTSTALFWIYNYRVPVTYLEMQAVMSLPLLQFDRVIMLVREKL